MTAISTILGRPVAPLQAATNDFRLTLESGVPASGSNQEAKTTLYLTPYVGNRIGLYVNSRWRLHESAEVSVSIPSNADTNSDVFAYWTGLAVALETVAWTNDTTRATAIVQQNGVWVKSGDATRRYIGTIRTTGVSGQCEDSYTKRFVWNFQNRISRTCFTTNTSASWTYGSPVWREANGGVGQLRFEFVCGDGWSIRTPRCKNIGRCTGTFGGNIGVCANATNTSHKFTEFLNIYPISSLTIGDIVHPVLVTGYNFITQVELVNSGTLTAYGGGSTTGAVWGIWIYWET